MKADREEVAKLVDNRLKEVKTKNFVQMEQAAVDKEKLTNDPHWNVFLQELQKRQNDYKEQLKGFETELRDTMLINADQILKIKNMINMKVAEIATLEFVIELPQSIINKGKEAKLKHKKKKKDKKEFKTLFEHGHCVFFL